MARWPRLSPVLCILHRLPLEQRIQDKLLLIAFKSVNNVIIIIIIIIIYPLTARVVGAPQMISQPVSSILFLFIA